MGYRRCTILALAICKEHFLTGSSQGVILKFQFGQHARAVLRHHEVGGQDARVHARRERLRQRGAVLQERLLGHALPRHIGSGKFQVTNACNLITRRRWLNRTTKLR